MNSPASTANSPTASPFPGTADPSTCGQIRAESCFANSMFAAQRPPTRGELAVLDRYRDRLPARLFREAFRLPASSGTGRDRDALERARALLREAGWFVRQELTGSRLVNADGHAFTLDLLTQNAAFQRVLLPYVETLRMLGIDARLRLLDSVMAVNLIDVCRALDRVLYWGKFGQPDETSAAYEYLVGSSVRILDSWWVR